MPIIDALPAEWDAWVTDDFVAETKADGVRAHEEIDDMPAPSAGNGIRAASNGVRRVVTELDGAYLSAVEGLGDCPERSALALPCRSAHGVTRMLRIDSRLERRA